MGLVVKELDRGWNALRDAMLAYRALDPHVKVGFFTAGPGAEQHGDDGLTVAELASVHEFGTDDGHIPARSFVGSTFDKNRSAYIDMLRKLLVQVYSGKLSLERVLGLMGLKMVADINATVRSGAGVPPPLAASTIERKGSSRPLIDTGRMLAALTHLVFMHEGEE